MTELIYFGHSSILFFTKPLFYLQCSFDTIYPLSFLQTFGDPLFTSHILSSHLTTPFPQLIGYFPKLWIILLFPPVKCFFHQSSKVKLMRGTQTQGSTVILLQLRNLPLWSNERKAIIHTHPRALSDHKMLVIQLKWDVVSQDNSRILPFAFINIYILLKKEYL